MKKLIAKRALALLCFAVLLCAVWGPVSVALTSKECRAWTVKNFYKEKKNTADIIILGSSHGYRSFSSMQIWEDRGYSCYNLSTSSQTYMSSYYLLKDAVRTQHPKAVVLELYAAWYDDKYGAHEVCSHGSFDYMPMSLNKLSLWKDELLKDFGFEKSFSYLFPVTLYHERWTELGSKDLHDTRAFCKGFMPSFTVRPQSAPQPLEGSIPMSDVTRSYLQKIIDLCRKENILLVGMASPMPAFDRYEITEGRIRDAAALLKENGFDAYSSTEMTDAIGINYETDFYNNSHINYLAASRITDFLEEYLDGHAQLEDHRGDPAYDSWTMAEEKYDRKVEKGIKALQTRTGEDDAL